MKKQRTFKGKQSFLHGAMILTIGMVIVKAVGALFKIPLANIITENGMGYFGTAYNFYSVLYSLATAGFPVAIAKMVAENYSLGRFNDVRQVKRVSMPIFLVTGSIGTVIMMLGARAYTNAVGNPNAFVPILCLAPSIFFCCMMSIYRGYYEGLRNMYPTAVSEIIEALSKLVFGLAGALTAVWYCNKEFESSGTVLGKVYSESQAVLTTYSVAASAAIIGVTLGSVLGFIYLVIYYRSIGDGITPDMYRGAPKPHSGKSIAKKLVLIAIPIAIGSLVNSIASLIDATFLQRRLGVIMATPEAANVVLDMYRGHIPAECLAIPESIPNFLYGCYGNALTIYMLVSTITQAFGVSALPSLTEYWAKGDTKEVKTSIESILRITCLFCIPAGLGIVALSEPIAALLYGSGSGTQIIGRILVILGVAAIFAAVTTPISSMLQAVGRVDLPVKFLMVGLIIKITLNYILCGIPEVNVLGAGTGSLVCYLLLTVLELVALSRVTKVKFDIKTTFVKPFFCAVLCALTAFGVRFAFGHFGISMRLACLVGISAAVVVYSVSLLITKTLTKSDVLMLPKGEKIAKILEKRGWIG